MRFTEEAEETFRSLTHVQGFDRVEEDKCPVCNSRTYPVFLLLRILTYK